MDFSTTSRMLADKIMVTEKNLAGNLLYDYWNIFWNYFTLGETNRTSKFFDWILQWLWTT
jgi:hypothetical protein